MMPHIEYISLRNACFTEWCSVALQIVLLKSMLRAQRGMVISHAPFISYIKEYKEESYEKK